MIQIGKIQKLHLLGEVASVEKYVDGDEAVVISQSRYNSGELEAATIRGAGKGSVAQWF